MDFDKAVSIIMDIEGGYVMDPNDPGGETKYGISKRSYPNEDIKNLTPERAKEIYLVDYWNMALCNRLPEKLKLIVFDCAVNQGVHFSQVALMKITSTPSPNAAANACMASKRPDVLLEQFAVERACRYSQNKNVKIYCHSWYRRLFQVALAS